MNTTVTVIYREDRNYGRRGGVMMYWLHELFPGNWELLASRWRPE